MVHKFLKDIRRFNSKSTPWCISFITKSSLFTSDLVLNWCGDFFGHNLSLLLWCQSSDMVELMLMQNAQMHQIIMHNMMLKALPPTAARINGSPPAGQVTFDLWFIILHIKAASDVKVLTVTYRRTLWKSKVLLSTIIITTGLRRSLLLATQLGPLWCQHKEEGLISHPFST